MPSVRIGFDGGNVINVAGVLYKKASGQPSSGAIDTTPTNTGIFAFTFFWDDFSVAYGPTHRTWTACEIGIAGWGTGNQASALCASGTVTYIYTAPSAGVVRLRTRADWFGVTAIYINGVWAAQGDFAGPNPWPDTGRYGPGATSVKAGDLVQGWQNRGLAQTIDVWFLPDVYP
jgi:hypothetical protein